MDSTHIKHSTRLQAFSDAIFSIVATVMILPIAHTELPDEEYLGPSFAVKILPQLGVYFATFLIVCKVWTNHVLLFMTIEYIDDVMMILNLGLLMSISFYPFTFTVFGQYAIYPLAILLFSSVIILSGLMQFFLVVRAFRRPELLYEDVRSSENQKSQRNKMFASILTPVIFAAIAAAVAYASIVAAFVFLTLILLGDFIRRNVIHLYKKICEKCKRPDLNYAIASEGELRTRLEEPVSTERVEAFSDGVYAIVATLIILDICEGNIPTPDDVKNEGLYKAMLPFLPDYLAYFGTFATVTLLAYVQHSLLHVFKEMNVMMVVFNNLSLMCIGVTPLAFRMATEYSTQDNRILRNEDLAIQLNCAIVFLASVFMMAMWIAALWNEGKFVKPYGRYGTNDHYYMCAKLAVFPLVTALVYGLSLGKSVDITVSAFNWMQVGCLGLFILFHIVYTNCKDKKSVRRRPEYDQIDEELGGELVQNSMSESYGSL